MKHMANIWKLSLYIERKNNLQLIDELTGNILIIFFRLDNVFSAHLFST